jgi:hypothetical protein
VREWTLTLIFLREKLCTEPVLMNIFIANIL